VSGHSKWSTIKHKKAASDAKKGKEFTRASNLISLAAKNGGDPAMNPSLAMAIDKAKSVNMPRANIERAIKKGTGELGGAIIEEVVYEGYGPGGIAILIETASDNKNRTVSEIRAVLNKHGGNMASSGAVAFNFERRGQIEILLANQKKTEEEIGEIIIDSGASDFEIERDHVIVYAEPKDLFAVKKSLENSGLSIDSAELTYVAVNESSVNEAERAEKIIKLIDSLEELDDVVNVHANADFGQKVLDDLTS
jgi:YebC/PmpR family DNA-binding regulatory protein